MLLVKGFKLLCSELNAWVVYILECFPGRCGAWLRYCYWKSHFVECGKRVYFSTNCKIEGSENIFLGNNISFRNYCQLNATGSGEEKIVIGDNTTFNSNVMVNAGIGGCIEIGKNCLIGPNVVLRTSNHNFSKRDIPIVEQGHKPGIIVIKDDVWVGANVSIVGSVVIGKGVIVGAGAVVVKDVLDYTIVAGVPAKQIGIR